MPCIQQHQSTKSPQCSSASKSSNLLRNSFSLEIYHEFLKYKKEKKQKAEEILHIEEEQRITLDKLFEIGQRVEFTPQYMKLNTFKEKMEILKQGRREKDALRSYLKELRLKMRHIKMMSVNFFKKLEEESKQQQNIKR